MTIFHFFFCTFCSLIYRFTLANLEKRKAGKAPNLSSLQEYIHKVGERIHAIFHLE